MSTQRAQAPCAGVQCRNSERMRLRVFSVNLESSAQEKVGKPHKGQGVPGRGPVEVWSWRGSQTNSSMARWVGCGLFQSELKTCSCFAPVQKSKVAENSTHRCSLVATV